MERNGSAHAKSNNVREKLRHRADVGEITSTRATCGLVHLLVKEAHGHEIEKERICSRNENPRVLFNEVT